MSLRIAIMVMLMTLAAMPLASASTTTRGPTWEETCINQTCTRTLYSGVRYVKYNCTQRCSWIPIEQAISLKDAWIPVYLELDPDFTIIANEYNYTDTDFIMQFTGDPLNYPTDCPTYKSPDEFKCQFKVQYKENGTDIKFDYKYEVKDGEIVQNTNKFSYKGPSINKKFTFGGNSTTIQLQDANTENLEDTYVNSSSVTTNYESFTI